MVSIYLDDCTSDGRLVRPLRAAGHLVHIPVELGTAGQTDETHLLTAARLGAVLTTHNQQDFAPSHTRWHELGGAHAGILLVRQRLPIGTKLAALERAAGQLAPESAYNQLMELALFYTDELAAVYIASLRR